MNLLRYKKTYEKIAMGLLSYMPDEKDLKKLVETMQQYENNENWHLFLMKKDDDFIGLIGIEEDDEEIILHHLSVNPSFRGEGIGKAMVAKVQELYSPKPCKSTELTKGFLRKCNESEDGEF